MAKPFAAFVVAAFVLAGTLAPAHAEELRQLGFEVIDGTNLSKAEMESRIRTFSAKLNGADVGLFFYAGHGLQVDGKNFLAPIDASLGTRSGVERFNTLASLDLNSDAPEQATLDALKAWQGPHCPVEEIAREEPGPATPPIVKPRPRVKQVGKNPRYIPPRYIPPQLHRAPPDQGQGDIETDAVHQNLRPAR